MPPGEFAASAAHSLAELNAIHPFRVGNGRAQLAFMSMLADRAGYSFDLPKIQPPRFLAAMVGSFFGKEDQLQAEIRRLTS